MLDAKLLPVMKPVEATETVDASEALLTLAHVPTFASSMLQYCSCASGDEILIWDVARVKGGR